jgi:hypothetical protein
LDRNAIGSNLHRETTSTNDFNFSTACLGIVSPCSMYPSSATDVCWHLWML